MNCREAQRRLSQAIKAVNEACSDGQKSLGAVVAIKALVAVYNETKSILEVPCQ